MANQNEQSESETTLDSDELATVAGGAGEVLQIKELNVPQIDTGAIENLRDRIGGAKADDTIGYTVF